MQMCIIESEQTEWTPDGIVDLALVCVRGFYCFFFYICCYHSPPFARLMNYTCKCLHHC